jgi:WD40 repeat protein
MRKLSLFYLLILSALGKAQTPPTNNKPMQLHEILSVATTVEPVKKIIMEYALDWKELAHIESKPVHALTFVERSKLLVTGESDGTINSWNSDEKGTYHKVQSYRPSDQKVTSINICVDRVLTQFANNTGVLTYHDKQQNNQIDNKFEFKNAQLAAQSGDGYFLATVNPQEPCTCDIWFINSGSANLDHHASVNCQYPIKALHGKHQAFMIVTEKNILDYRTISKKIWGKKYFESPNQPITAVTCSPQSPQGALTVIGLSNGNIALIDTTLRQSPIAQFITDYNYILNLILDYHMLSLEYLPREFNNSILTLALSSDMRYLACLGQDNLIKIFKKLNDTQYGFTVSQVLEHASRVHCLAFSPDNKYLAIGADDGAHIWHVQDKKAPSK